MKRIVAISDLHCGHRVGLTPPQYNARQSDNHTDRKLHTIRREVWNWYAATLRSLQPIYCLIVCGDCTDGHGSKSGGSELLVPNLNAQADVAAECVLAAKAQRVVMVYGTHYHVSDVGGNIDLEDRVAEKVAADKIGAHEWVRVSGCPTVFDVAHYVGGSSSPALANQDLAKQTTWNALWAEADGAPRADWFLRGHVHTCEAQMRVTDRVRWAMTMPALCGFGSKFGARICRKIVHVGMATWECGKSGVERWEPLLARLPAHKASVTEV